MSEAAVPRMVTLVRDEHGWSQTELARRSGLSQGYISKVENGLIPLTGEALQAVADALECPVALLSDDTPLQGLEVTCLHHRRRGSKMTAAMKRRIEASANLSRITVEGLLNGVDLEPEIGLRRFDIDEFGGDAAEAARAVRAAWRVPSGPIPNLLALIEAVGVIVVVRTLHTRDQDAFSTWPSSGSRPPIMILNEGLPGDRQRWTMAHELGHLVLHLFPDDDQEKQADTFASELLAPAEEIAPQLAGLSLRDFPRLLMLKAQWGMSVAALIRRAKDLDLITDRTYRSFQIKLSELGWRTNEPGDVPVETPQTLDRVMQLHVDEHEYNLDELAICARMLPEKFTRRYQPPGVEPERPLRLVLKPPALDIAHDQVIHRLTD